MVGKQPSNLVGFSYKLSEQGKIRHCCCCSISNNRSMTRSLSLHSQAFPHFYSFCSRQMEMFQGRLNCLLFLRLLKKQQKFQMCFSGQVRVYTSIFDPINLTDWNTGVLPPSLGAQKTKYSVGVGQEINLATPEKCNFGSSPSGGPCCCLIFFFPGLPKRMLLK